jgi:hypothetical protein
MDSRIPILSENFEWWLLDETGTMVMALNVAFSFV